MVVFNPIKMTCSPKSWAGFREQARIIPYTGI
jgi:hypothetical protein